MNLRLEIRKDNKIILQLIDGRKKVGSLAWEENNNLSRNLLRKIDVILNKNKISLDKVSKYKIISEVPDNWTTYRIAKITLESLILAKKIGL